MKNNEDALVIEEEQRDGRLRIMLEGRLDTNTAPRLEQTLKNAMEGITELILDFAKLKYISSAGLRVILSAQKTMSRQGIMRIRNVNSIVMEIFTLTGFADILTIE